MLTPAVKMQRAKIPVCPTLRTDKITVSLFITDYVPYVNAVDSRWSAYGSDSTSSARYVERYRLFSVFC